MVKLCVEGIQSINILTLTMIFLLGRVSPVLGSVMAKLCVEGMQATYSYCDQHNIPYKKVILVYFRVLSPLMT